MKEVFEEVKMEVIDFCCDVITTSGFTGQESDVVYGEEETVGTTDDLFN